MHMNYNLSSLNFTGEFFHWTLKIPVANEAITEDIKKVEEVSAGSIIDYWQEKHARTLMNFGATLLQLLYDLFMLVLMGKF